MVSADCKHTVWQKQKGICVEQTYEDVTQSVSHRNTYGHTDQKWRDWLVICTTAIVLSLTSQFNFHPPGFMILGSVDGFQFVLLLGALSNTVSPILGQRNVSSVAHWIRVSFTCGSTRVAVFWEPGLLQARKLCFFFPIWYFTGNSQQMRIS